MWTFHLNFINKTATILFWQNWYWFLMLYWNEQNTPRENTIFFSHFFTLKCLCHLSLVYSHNVSLLCRSWGQGYLHLCGLEWVVVALPMVPVHPIPESLVLTPASKDQFWELRRYHLFTVMGLVKLYITYVLREDIN